MPKFTSITIEGGLEQFGGTGKYPIKFPSQSFGTKPTVIVSVAGFYLTSIESGTKQMSLFAAAENVTP